MTALPSAEAAPGGPAEASPFRPAPGAASLPRMIVAQASLEAKTLVRNGEQLLLVLIIPVLLLLGFSLESFISIGSKTQNDRVDRVAFLVPGIIALAIMSTAFTSQAIATGFERRYGVLKRLGATPLSRVGLIAAKTCTVIAVELVQAVIIIGVGFALGWRPHATAAGVAWAVLLAAVGTAAFSGLALLMAGTLRAEATLAAANLVYLVLLGVGGVLFPLDKFPTGARGPLKLLPSGALSDGLHHVLGGTNGVPVRGVPVQDLVVLVVWAVVGIGLAARTFKWE